MQNGAQHRLATGATQSDERLLTDEDRSFELPHDRENERQRMAGLGRMFPTLERLCQCDPRAAKSSDGADFGPSNLAR